MILKMSLVIDFGRGVARAVYLLVSQFGPGNDPGRRRRSGSMSSVSHAHRGKSFASVRAVLGAENDQMTRRFL